MGVTDVVAKGRDWVTVEFAHFLQAGTWRGELELQRKDGSLVAVEVQATPVELPSGTTYVSILRDITARKQVEEQLAFQADVLSQVSDAVIAIDNEHQITYWNPAAEQLYGFTAAEVLGRPVEEVTHYQWFNPADEPAAYETLTTRSSWQGENWHVTRHGEPLHVESTVSVLKDTAERPIGLLAVIRDITERKRAEEAEYFLAQSSAILASSLDYGTTIEQIVRLAVPTLADWCTLDILEEGHSRCVAVAHVDPAKEALLWELRRRYPIFPDGPSPGSQVLRTEQSVLYPQFRAGELSQTTQDSEHLRLITALAPVAAMAVPLIVHGETIGVMTLASIRSERQSAQREVRLAEELAHQAALAVEHAQLYQQAQQAIRAREEFLSIASHELKTPLTTLKGSTQLLARQLRQPVLDRDRLQGYTQRFQQQLERMETLVADLLDASRVQQGRLELRREHCDLRALADEVLARFEHAAERTERHQLVLEAPEPVLVVVDPSRIDQVLVNLVSNALKYSAQGGEVRLGIAQQNGRVVITVRDQGVGISAADQEQLFHPFVRSEAVRGSVSGTGLGLYITRQIVEQHGGTISIDSEPGYGTTVTIQLPQ
jgi:PAS domain S-box-containing protein